MIAPLLLNGDERDAHGDVRLDSGAVLGLQWLRDLHATHDRCCIIQLAMIRIILRRLAANASP